MKPQRNIWILIALLWSAMLYANTSVEESLQKGLACKQRGEYIQALSFYQKALESTTNRQIQAKIQYNTASLLLEMGQLEQSKSILLALCSQQPRTLYRNHAALRLTELYWFSEDYGHALSLVDSLLATVSYRDSLLYPFVLQNKATFLYEQDPEDTLALRYMRQAGTYYDAASTPYHVLLSNIALSEAHCGQFLDALKHIEKSIDFFRTFPDPVRHTRSIRKKAEILLLKQDWKESQKAYEEYFQRERSYLIENFAQMTEQNRLDFWKKEKPLLSEIFALENHAPDFLLDVALFRREVALLGRADSVNIPHRLAITGRDVRAKMQKDEVSIDFVRYIKNDTVWYGAIVVPSLRSGRKVRFVSLCTEQDMDDFRTEIYAVSGEESKSYIYENSTLAHLIWDRLLPYMKDAKHIYFAPDGILHMLAIEYLYPLIDENPSVSLHRLTSISRLLSRKPRRPISQQKILAVGGLRYSRLYAQHDSLGLHHEAVNYFTRVTNAAPWFNSLSGALRELQQIDSIHTGDASANTIMTEGMLHQLWRDTSYTITHFATHGYALHVDVPAIPYMMRDSITEDQSLWASGIAMSGANKAYQRPCGEDAIVSAREICDMDLRHIDLMVVSACQGAQGHVADEGPAGLVRGLKKAGVRTVVATLWAINDESTSLLMGEFYRQLKTCSPTEAMRRAQKYVREYESLFPYYWDPACMCYRNVKPWDVQRMTRVRRFESPYYWAAFLVIDDI